MISIDHYLVLSLALFVIGVAGALVRRNLLVTLMSIDLILTAVNINLAAFSRMWGNVNGQVFALFIIACGAAEAVAAVGIVLVVFRSRKTALADELDLLKW
ncbi:MAG: NADH-quinone oxidoreductase subunit NuoK [Candidatus Acidiferrales bacterium]